MRKQDTSGTIEVPASKSTVEEMWEELKMRGVHNSLIDWREIQEREHAEKHLLQWCVLHFAQALSTPLASEAWLCLTPQILHRIYSTVVSPRREFNLKFSISKSL